MANEAAKARTRLLSLFVGKGLDIGCGNTPIMDSCDKWDIDEGDAQYMIGAPREHYDWIFSSHLLEHVKDPANALAVWWRLLKPGGTLIILVPDEDLYEKGLWPSQHNGDHKHTFTLSKWESWSPVSRNMVDLLHNLPGHKLIDLSLQDTGYDYSKPDSEGDQSSGSAEVSIQLIVRKEAPQVAANTRLATRRTTVTFTCGDDVIKSQLPTYIEYIPKDAPAQ